MQSSINKVSLKVFTPLSVIWESVSAQENRRARHHTFFFQMPVKYQIQIQVSHPNPKIKKTLLFLCKSLACLLTVILHLSSWCNVDGDGDSLLLIFEFIYLFFHFFESQPCRCGSFDAYQTDCLTIPCFWAPWSCCRTQSFV